MDGKPFHHLSLIIAAPSTRLAPSPQLRAAFLRRWGPALGIPFWVMEESAKASRSLEELRSELEARRQAQADALERQKEKLHEEHQQDSAWR